MTYLIDTDWTADYLKGKPAAYDARAARATSFVSWA